MFIDRILYPVTALGPGNRIALWVAGCSRQCKGCANPELWTRHPYQQITPNRLSTYVNGLSDKPIDGITITGGEPFDQAQELAVFLEGLKVPGDVLVFTGYNIEELKDARYQSFLNKIDVLIDGAYVEEQNDNQAALRGSLNQSIHYLNGALASEYQAYLKKGRQIQNFIYDYKTISVGIHNR